ncbi:dienelactone hydrolase family protein [Kribbella sp. NPDC056861]|uniref:dienelactone hydrolase family protein n=1 Tax=Kribbella sp. NPDC056861 TaxID=3154857 RepID=UPI0034172472
MATIVLFHHAQGLTKGVRAFADTLSQAGHVVHLPDLYEGNVYETLDEGLDYARQTGFGTVKDRGIAAADELAEGATDGLIYAGFSLGVMPAQQLAQTRSNARGALLLHGCIPVSEFGEGWPAGVPVQVHAMDQDPFFIEEGGDLESANALVAAAPDDAELFLYPGDHHLFSDSSLPAYDEAATALLTSRVLAFLKDR